MTASVIVKYLWTVPEKSPKIDQLTQALTHWSRVTHICISKLTILGPDNGLSPGRHQAINWTNAGILLIWHLGTNFIEILIEIQTFSFEEKRLKMSSVKWRPFCLGLNVLKTSSSKFVHGKHSFGKVINEVWYQACNLMRFIQQTHIYILHQTYEYHLSHAAG